MMLLAGAVPSAASARPNGTASW